MLGNHPAATDDCTVVATSTPRRTRSSSQRGSTPARLLASISLTGLLAVGAVACGGGDGGSSANGDTVSTSVDGSIVPSAERGEQIARSNGCAGCHGKSFEGAAGPTWTGLAGSEVTLADGTTTVADDAYLTRAIADPGADLVADYTLKMPRNSLSAAEIADIVAYINTLAEG